MRATRSKVPRALPKALRNNVGAQQTAPLLATVRIEMGPTNCVSAGHRKKIEDRSQKTNTVKVTRGASSHIYADRHSKRRRRRIFSFISISITSKSFLFGNRLRRSVPVSSIKLLNVSFFWNLKIIINILVLLYVP